MARPSSRKCIFPGCQARQSSSVSLFTFPKNEELKKSWLDFVKRHHYDGVELKISSTARLCSQHFTPESFHNLQRRQLGFTENPLVLVGGAKPTVVPSSLPPIAPLVQPQPAASTVDCTAVASSVSYCLVVPSLPPTTPLVQVQPQPASGVDFTAVGSHARAGAEEVKVKEEVKVESEQDGACLQFKHSRDISCQTVTQMTISVGTQLYKGDLKLTLETRSFGTQLSKNTLVSQRCKASQASVLSVSVGVGTPVPRKRPPSVLGSARQEPMQPSKRRRLTLDEDVDEYDGDSTEVTDPDSTYIPAQSVSTEPTLLHASPSINVLKYLVDEVCLLQLFEECPVCRSTCEVHKTTRGNLLTVHQLCSHCNFNRNWRSQQTEKTVPLVDARCTGDPESSAAAITEIIGDENDSSDEGSSEVDQGEDNSDSDWVPQKYHNSDIESDADENKEALRQLCPECGAFFHNQSQRAHICGYKKPYSCNVCGKRFLSEVHLKVHNKIHEDGYKHACTYCFSTFRTRADKLVHEQSHPPAKKPYQCPDCPQVFARMRERRKHLLSHRGPRHICHICNMVFLKNSTLERHMVVHTKAKQFVCEVCQRSFNQSGHLKSHMRVHTGEKPYQCQHCDKSFNHNVSLKSHIQRYHGQVPDPGMEVQTEKTSSNESEAEKDETNEKERSPVDADQSMDTLCNTGNGGEEEEEKKEEKCTKKCYYRPPSSGRPIGRPKKMDTNQLKRPLCISDEKDQGNSESTDEEHDSDSDFEPAKWRAQSRKDRGRCRGKQK